MYVEINLTYECWTPSAQGLSVSACSTVRRIGSCSLRFLSLAHRPWRNLHPRVPIYPTEDTREPHRRHKTLVVVYKCIMLGQYVALRELSAGQVADQFLDLLVVVISVTLLKYD